MHPFLPASLCPPHTRHTGHSGHAFAGVKMCRVCAEYAAGRRNVPGLCVPGEISGSSFLQLGERFPRMNPILGS